MLNRATIIGNVGNDPETRTFTDGGRVASFSIATTDRWKGEDGQPVEKTEWHRISVQSDGLVKIVEQYVKKGSKLYVEGKLETREWEDRQGGFKRTATEIVLRPYNGRIELLDAPTKPESNGNRRGAKRDPKP